MSRNKIAGIGMVTLAFLGFSLVVLGLFGRGRGDGIEAGRAYALAYTYKVTIKGGGPGRVFDFADRSLPRTSIVVPLYDDRGMPLVRENQSLPPSTVRKVIASVPTRKMEGVTYPGYTYVLWEYNLGVKEPQSVVPTITPNR